MILVFTKLKLLNLTYMPQSSTATYYMGLYVAYEVFRSVNLEVRNVIFQLISKSTNDRVFTQQVLHDIKSPIGVLRILLSQIKWDESQTEVKEAILGSVGRIQSLSRSAVASSLETEKADLRFIANLIREFEVSRRGQTNYEVDLDLEARLPIRQSTLVRIVQNLVANATEAAQVTRISLRGTKRNGFYCLEVSNDGTTVPADVLNQILTSGGTYAKEGGSGVGVQFCKTEVERAGGRFNMTSENGQTRVAIELPLAHD